MKAESSWFILVFIATCLLSQATTTSRRSSTGPTTKEPTEGFTSTPSPPAECFNRSDYVLCEDATDYHPAVCNCTNSTGACYVKLIITRNCEIENRGQSVGKNVYSINGGATGPTIIVKHDQILAVDVINEIPDKDTSIHWHGMHQKNMPWMDGVGMVTQWPIPRGGGKFRYIFKAHPSGTHWYHSHVGQQRDEGIFGALIVEEEPPPSFPEFTSPIVDDPAQFTLAVTEHLKVERGEINCGVGSAPPDDYVVRSFQVNGKKLSGQLAFSASEQKPAFVVEHGHNYRFRVIGAMEQTIFRMSIAGHNLSVIATDGYLVKPYEVDILHVHVGERYDFVVETLNQSDVQNRGGNVFPIQIDSVAVFCDQQTKPLRSGFAYLKYNNSDSPDSFPANVAPYNCENKCKALNCPFKKYPEATGLHNVNCYDVTNLKLLVNTSEDELPRTSQPSTTNFLNFHFHTVARVNDVRFDFSTKPLLMSGDKVSGECLYNETKYRQCDTSCPHVIYIDGNTSVAEFVFSSLPRGSENFSKRKITKLITHPIHLHGHSFWVKKIVYPDYNKDGGVENVTDDIIVPPYGHGKWKDETDPQHNSSVDTTTIRKDVIIVPAGGYVVVDIKVQNPGWWFLHCHIDHHLLEGMAVVVAEMSDCIQRKNASEALEELYNQPDEFCFTVDDFHQQVNDTDHACNSPSPAQPPNSADASIALQEDELNVIEDASSFNHEDNNDEAANYKPSLYDESEQEQPRFALREFLKKHGIVYSK